MNENLYFLIIYSFLTEQEGQNTIYMKNCGDTGMYHASGCLHIDDADLKAKGTVCFCSGDKCNTNFDANKNSGAASITSIYASIVVLASIALQ